MQTFVIERHFGHVTDEQVAAAGSLSKRIASEQFGDSIVWKQSYASEGDDGLSTVCVYDSTGEDAIRAHAAASGMPCDRITPVKVITPDDFA